MEEFSGSTASTSENTDTTSRNPVNAVSIKSRYAQCLTSFNSVLDSIKYGSHPSDSAPFPIEDLSTELGRFRVWAGNTGAHRTGRVSLDHRLREVPEIHAEISELLRELELSLVQGMKNVDYVAFGLVIDFP